MKRLTTVFILILILNKLLMAQDYVNITFRHYPTRTGVVRAFVPGTFNNWGPNNNGRIDVNAPSLMTYIDSLGYYVKTVRLIASNRYEYKFHEHYNESGSEWSNPWITDPLNPLINYSDNNNSILYVTKAMIFEISPKNDDLITISQPTIVAGVFTTEYDSILLDQSLIFLDGRPLTTFADHMITNLSILSFKTPVLSNGDHRVVFHVVTQNGELTADSTCFSVLAGDIFFLTPSCDSVCAGMKTIRWRVNMGHTKLQCMTLKQINSHPLTFSAETEKEYESVVTLRYGENKYVVSVTDTAGINTESDTLYLFYPQPQKPEPEIIFQLQGDKIKVVGKGNDPQNGNVDYLWSTQNTNVAPLPLVDGRTDESFEIDIPATPGDYALKLVVTDENNHSNSTVNFFTVNDDLSIVIPQLITVPSWVADARIYCLFIKSYTDAGTIQATTDNLEHIKNMGFDVIWVLPVMDVEGIVDQGSNIGYNIIDFYNVEPAYGTNDDFKALIQRAHELGLRIILDVTPNHSSRSHPIALDVRSKKKFSRYYDFYQHNIIPHNDNGLGQSISYDGIVYYSGFSDALLNWNWADEEARKYMIAVYTHWLREYDIDGFRFDVYWGPHRRYGTANFDQQLRAELRHAKADIMLLGETDGTGTGTEIQYADRGGGLDLGYDWILKGTTEKFPSISMLDERLYNSGYRPGSNSFFLRFLENQDEDRIAYRYDSIEKTIPVSTAIFMATGIPQLFQGQEVGMGYKMGNNRDDRVRSTVNWHNPYATILTPHYQKLAQIRFQFPAFRRQMEDLNHDYKINSNDPSMQPRLLTTNNNIYAFGRPYPDQNGIAVMNFCNTAISLGVILRLDDWAEFSEDIQPDQVYFVNNLYENTSTTMLGADLDTLYLTLNAYDVAIYTISTKQECVELPQLKVTVAEQNTIFEPRNMQLFPNYPNPFNPSTTIQYELPTPAYVRLEIYNLHGQRVRTLLQDNQSSGLYRILWDGYTDDGRSVTSAVYLCRLQAGDFVQTRKMLLIR